MRAVLSKSLRVPKAFSPREAEERYLLIFVIYLFMGDAANGVKLWKVSYFVKMSTFT